MKKLIAIAAAVALAAFALAGCSIQQSIPENTSQEMYDVGCEALEIFDEALDSNDLFNSGLQEKLKTVCTKAREASRNGESNEDGTKKNTNDSEILGDIQKATIYIAQNNGDKAIDSIEKLRSDLGKE